MLCDIWDNYVFFCTISGDMTSRLTSDVTTMAEALNLNVNVFLRSVISASTYYVSCLHVLCRNICTCVKRPYLRALNKGAFTVVESKGESEHLLVHFRHLIWTTDIKSDIGFTLTFGSVNAPLSHVFRIRQSHRFWSAVLLLSLVLNVTSMMVQYLKVRKTVSLTLNTNKGLNSSVLIR